MVPMMKKPTKKKPVVKKGLHLNKSPKGFSVSVHSANGNKLCALHGYNTKQAALKGVLALNRALNGAFDIVESKYEYTDNTVKKKP
jgi:hypothetical protein